MTNNRQKILSADEPCVELDACRLFDFLYQMAAAVDNQPKNAFFSEIPKGEEYKHMCISLFQGYEMDWVTWPDIMVNEFGEAEHYDDFLKRHPNFGEDIRNAFNL